MAANTNQTDVFKFVALRPPVIIDQVNKTLNFIKDNRSPDSTPVGKLVITFDKKDGTNVPNLIREFIKANKYSHNYPETGEKQELEKIFVLAKSINESDISKLKSLIESLTDRQISTLLNNDLLSNIWDRYYAFFMLGKFEPQNLESFTQDLRTFHLLKLISEGAAINDKRTLDNIITATPLIDKIFSELPPPKIEEKKAPEEEKPSEIVIKQYKEVWNDLINAHRAVNEVKNLTFESKSTSETKEVLIPNKETGIAEKTKITSSTHEWVVSNSSFSQLHIKSKEILNSLNISDSALEMESTIMKLNDKLQESYNQVLSIDDPYFFDIMPKEVINIGGLRSKPNPPGLINKADVTFLLEDLRAQGLIKPLGIGDLKVVKQKLKKYVAGEVAHIENVLKGESKERKHRVLDRTEDIFTVFNETDEETIKDTQTTERFELKKESEKTIQEQMSIQAGVTVTSSFGPVTTGAHGDFAYSTASNESIKNSSNFAREVIDKSISKIQKKTKEERTTKKLHEVEEINTHGIHNVPGTGHISGIYRWVDKVYEAQIYNYGQRMMLEFIIPEPASFYEYAQTVKRKLGFDRPMAFELKSPCDIKIEGLDKFDYLKYIKAYNVQGVTPPPAPYKTITTSIVKDAMALDGNAHSIKSNELVIPSGYELINRQVHFDCSGFFKNYPRMEVLIGRTTYKLYDNGIWIGALKLLGPQSPPFFGNFYEGSSVQIAVNSYDFISYAITAYAVVKRTDGNFQKWQIETFEKIVAAYNAAMAEYEQKLAAQEVQQGIAIHGQNPRINREIEQTELKKHCLKMLMDPKVYGKFDSMGKAKNSEEPVFNNLDAYNEGKIIQFFEQAFDWQNLTYLFYPYFWSKKGTNAERWVEKSKIYDTDPLFTRFLQAGSSRVVIPIHPAYNDVIAYYIQTGEIWGKDGNPPLIKKDDGSANDLFISIAEELRNRTDDLANATPEGTPWEIVLPTTLVYLQQDMDLPTTF